MKECEWCGIDFRGEPKTLEEHFFCSRNCLEDYRKDVYGDDGPAEKATADSEPGTDEGETAEQNSESG